MQKRKSFFYFGLNLLLTITLINLSCKKDGNGPNISSITPSNVTTGQEITIEGSNLLQFIRKDGRCFNGCNEQYLNFHCNHRSCRFTIGIVGSNGYQFRRFCFGKYLL